MVDDEVIMRNFIAKALIARGYQVDAAEDGAVAWNTLQANTYDLIITDNHMPKVSGVELIEKVRAAGMGLPVIMVTGTDPEDEFTQQPWLRPAATLLKPYSLAELFGGGKKRLARSRPDGNVAIMSAGGNQCAECVASPDGTPDCILGQRRPD
jgi:two-component system alkaline phosphatase synthesis response regulator PhoP